MLTRTDLDTTARFLAPILAPTPALRWPLLCARIGTEVWVKHENHLPTGAFKVRGGLVYVDAVLREQPKVRGVITATRGNHGQSIGFAAARRGLRAVIAVPHGNSREKNAAMRALGVELVETGHDFQAAREYATARASAEGLHLVPSWHRELVRGVATYGLELLLAVPDLDTVYVPIGMGSGVCGVIAARDALGLSTRVVGVVAEGAPATALSFAAGTVVTTPAAETIADGVATRVPDPQALAMIRRGAERIVTVGDAAIRQAMRDLFTDLHQVAEGAAAIGFAALAAEAERMRGKRVAVILSGGNVDRTVFAEVIAGE